MHNAKHLRKIEGVFYREKERHYKDRLSLSEPHTDHTHPHMYTHIHMKKLSEILLILNLE